MPELPRTQRVAQSDKGPHYALINNTAPDWLKNADLERLHPLSELVLQRPTWYATATAQQHATLKALNGQAWAAQNTLDTKLRPVQDVYAFAEPLLKRAIKDQYALDLDVKTTYLRIYTPKKLPWYALELSNGVTSRDVSLLDAALHNFAGHEAFERYSCYITRPDYRGHFSILHHERTMSLEQFKTLCRELDLGARYQQHLKQFLLPDEPVAQGYLQGLVTASQKATLKAAAQMALMNNDLQASAYAVVMGVLDGTEQRATFYQLSMLDTPLTGILLISTDLDRAASVAKVIAYIPNDPASPLKQYASSSEFVMDLSRRLQLNAPLPSSKHLPQHTYQQFFSQFVPHARRGLFFATLTEHLYRVQWHERSPLDPAPAWCEDPVDKPFLKFEATKIKGALWPHLYQASFNKILNDGRSLAVSTAQADSQERRSWWDNVLKIASDLFNVALLVVTPFVPGLGELMLAYTLYQLTDDVLEGIVDLSEGQAGEAAQHVISVVTDVLQLALMGTGGVLAKEVLFKPSAFVNSLKAVQVNGQTRLWNPDLAPYVRNDLHLPEGSRPDALGLHAHQGQTVVRLEERHLVLEHDAQSNTHRIQHATRRGAYSPLIEPNGSGAWVHEGEDPWAWDDAQLRGRLGHGTQALDARQVEQACSISGTDDSALRQMYVELKPTPPLLADTLMRMHMFDQAKQLPQKIRNGGLTQEEFNWSAQLSSELKNWPSDKAIKVFYEPDLTGYHITYGTASDAAHTLNISHQDINAGALPERLVGFLTEAELQALLPAPLPDTPAARTAALRDLLATKVASEHISIFNHLYSTHEVLNTAPAQLLRTRYPQLPAELIQRLMLRVSPDEVKAMGDEQRIPLRVSNLATELQNESIASHAYEGFYNDELITPDTERMVLNILRRHRDTLGDVNISLYQHSPAGRLRAQAGPQDAGTQIVLLRKDDGRYQVRGQTPAAHYDLFEALLRALPADSVDYVPGEGRLFKRWLKDQLQAPAERRTALEAPSLRKPDPRVTQKLLQKPMFGAFRRLFTPATPPTTQERVAKLFPRLRAEPAQTLLDELAALENGDQILEALETEKRQLQEDFKRWKRRPTQAAQYSEQAENETYMRDRIIDDLVECWEARADGRVTAQGLMPRGRLLDLSEKWLGRYIRSLGRMRANFDHVTVLNLMSTGFMSGDVGFLDNFPNLRGLDLSNNVLFSVPTQMTTLRDLVTVDLSHNPITWSHMDFTQLYECRNLEYLNLQDHPDLKVAPDLRSLPHLKQLVLRNTGVTEWPLGMEVPRAHPLELNLLNTGVKQIPVLPEGSPAIDVIAHSWLDRAALTNADEARFVAYRRASGIDPYRTLPAGDPEDSEYWLDEMKPELLDEARALWNTLENQPGSQGFFEILKLLRPSQVMQTEADRKLFKKGRKDLKDRVWDVLVAIDRDPQLRERFFAEASAPVNCADAGAQVFNKLGIETLLADILQDSTEQGLATRDNKLVELAWQTWRLKQLNEFAKQDIIRRTQPVAQGGLGLGFGSGALEVDEVQVYLAYQTGLKTRLDLPWLSEHMAYRNTAKVTRDQLDAAYQSVISAAANDGAVKGVLDQDFWRDHLEDKHADQYAARRRERDDAGGELADLLDEQKEWAATETTPERKAQLRTQIVRRLNEFKRMGLKIADSTILVDHALSDATVQKLYEEVQRPYRELGIRLTREALQNAGL